MLKKKPDARDREIARLKRRVAKLEGLLVRWWEAKVDDDWRDLRDEAVRIAKRKAAR